MKELQDIFSLKGGIYVITGGAGLIGKKHAEAVLIGGGVPVLVDINDDALQGAVMVLHDQFPDAVIESYNVDITNKQALESLRNELHKKYGRIDGLINNAANNPKVEAASKNLQPIQFHNFPLDLWNDDLAVGLTGAMLCAQVFGCYMAEQNKGVILNISSDYGLIAPNQSIYRKEGLKEEEQIVKPVSYSVVKHGIIGLTKYLAVYWAQNGIRVNTLCPASLENGQDAEFISKISNLIPMGRMSRPDEYIGTVLYMLSDATSYMNGATVVLDGGRTIW